MTPEELSQHQRTLMALQRQLVGKRPVKVAPNRASDTPDVGSEEDEQPLNEMMQSIASNLNRNSDGVLKLVRKAIAKIEHNPDDYGLCEECDDEIEEGRLKAMPYAQFCVECQHKKDPPKVLPTRRSVFEFK